MNPRRFRLAPAILAAAAAGLPTGCASEPTLPPLDAPISALLAIRGSAVFVPGDRSEEVVVIRDRHFTGGGLTYVDEDLRKLQREHRRVVGDLVERGFVLLGAEWRQGPLPEDEAAEAHRDAVRDVLAEGDDLNRWSVYQPIRYAVEFDGRLTVVGVEDPAMYDADVAALERLIEISRAARRNDTTTGPTDEALARERLRIRRAMSGRVDPRGDAAARNLVAAMEERRVRRAVLVLGAAHVPAASRALAELGVPHHVFTAPAFERRDLRGAFDPR